MKEFRASYSWVNLLLLAPLPFLTFHAFIFSCWYLRHDALDVTFALGSATMFVFSLRLNKYIPLNFRNQRSDRALLKIWQFPYVLELMFWYGATVSAYYFLWSEFNFPQSLESEETEVWRLALLGYGLFFLGAFVFASALRFIKKAIGVIKADFEKVLLVIPRIASVSAIYFLVDICFAVCYRLASIIDSEAFSRPLNGFVDSLYFSTITITTLGYGDIYPKSTYLKILVSVETLLGIGLLAAVLSTSISVALNTKVENENGKK